MCGGGGGSLPASVICQQVLICQHCLQCEATQNEIMAAIDIWYLQEGAGISPPVVWYKSVIIVSLKSVGASAMT